jgi:hypothetical protein
MTSKASVMLTVTARRGNPRRTTLARDPGRPAASLAEFVGYPAYRIQQLRADLDRFTFLLGGSDGEPLFGLPQD